METEDLQQRLQAAANSYNQLLAHEQELERKRIAARDERLAAFGKLQALDELVKDALAEASVNKSENGDGDTEHIAVVSADASEQDNPTV